VGGPDALLAARLAAGDDLAIAEIFDRLAPAVYGAALHVLGESAAAQDVVQDVFVDLWSHPARYDPEAGAVGADPGQPPEITVTEAVASADQF
jgi:RNA polymerase sigma-70 factor, ECF subfamily